MTPDAQEFIVTFDTLGDLWSAWIEQHCRIPDRVERGKPFREYDWQFWCTANDGRIREGVEQGSVPLLNQAFVYRRSQVIAPQKIGKGPWTAARVALAAVGPSEFDGWAKVGEVYSCEANGCPCGWVFPYDEGEPKGRRHPDLVSEAVQLRQVRCAHLGRLAHHRQPDPHRDRPRAPPLRRHRPRARLRGAPRLLPDLELALAGIR